jgi:DNA helicase-2/ATP-dependent DNA helicase PcrA
VPLTQAARAVIETDELRPQARASLGALIDSIDRWRGLLGELPHAEVIEIMLDESGYTAMLQNDKSPAAPGRLENLTELVRAIAEFETLEAFLEHVSLVMDIDDRSDGDMVNIMTLHSAKGLEFDTVFLAGWEEGLFPHELALQESGTKGLEEERRLAYVGITRARQRVRISHAANRRRYNQWQSSIPSRFVDELPDEYVERLAAPGLYGGLNEESSNFPRALGGWSRRRKQPAVDALSYDAVDHAPDTFAPGARVFHQKFGYGRISAIDGNKLEIAFDKAGDKKVIDSFVRLA